MKWFNLKTIILSIVIATLVLTLLVNVWSANAVNTKVLTDNTLETNRVYAEKLAKTVDLYIEETFNTLQFSAEYLQDKLDDEELLTEEAQRLRETNEMFNSVIIVNKDAYVIGVSPPSLELKNTYLHTEGPKEAIEKQVPLISKPYIGATKRLLIFISHPIFDKNGDYLGFVGGSIYIREDNAFNKILGDHFYDDGSYVYVVDTEGRIIYHKDPNRLNDQVTENIAVQALLKGQSGSTALVNTKGVDMLAGYSYTENAGWGIVSQRPLDVALAPVSTLLQSLWKGAIPLLIVLLAIVIFITIRVTSPLTKLAKITNLTSDEAVLNEIRNVPASYYETKRLKQTLLDNYSNLFGQVSTLQKQTARDGLTGLYNRRAMDDLLANYTAEQKPYTIALLDLDHFKKVNDEFGHAIGDEVLIYLARKMEEYAGHNNYCCRYGGEEFVIIFTNDPPTSAYEIVESLRLDLARSTSPSGLPVTMSAGIAGYPVDGKNERKVLAVADTLLYKAKNDGRNRVIV